MDAQQTIADIFQFANLGAQTYLQDQAITSPRPATITLGPNGQVISATGGGALPISGSVNVGGSSLWLFALLAVLFVVLLLGHR